VARETCHVIGERWDDKWIQSTKENILWEFNQRGWDFTNLVNQLFELNRKTAIITLNSSPVDGYNFEYEKNFEQYFNKELSKAWEQWHADNPKAYGIAHISIPAYDTQTGYLVVYAFDMSGPVSGRGTVYAYKYTAGQLIKIGSHILWVS